MPKLGGYLQIFDPDHPTVERDSICCGHCNRAVFVKPGSGATVYLLPHRDGRWTEEAGAFCRVCMRPVCLRCHDVGSCTPIERWLEQQERPQHP
jgi:hypothetical protein